MLKPTGVLSVTRVAPNAVEGLVLEVYDGVRMGDFVRPAPLYDLVPGQYPDVVTNRTEATIIEFGQLRQVYGLKQVAMLNKGSRDGVAIGDEYVTFFGDGSTEEIMGRIRAVLTEEETSSAEIVTVYRTCFPSGHPRTPGSEDEVAAQSSRRCVFFDARSHSSSLQRIADPVVPLAPEWRAWAWPQDRVLVGDRRRCGSRGRAGQLHC